MQKAKYLNDLMTQYESEEIISKKIDEISFEKSAQQNSYNIMLI